MSLLAIVVSVIAASSSVSMVVGSAVVSSPSTQGKKPVSFLAAPVNSNNYSLSANDAQLAINSFLFIIEAPQNCLETLEDLPSGLDKNMAALWIRGAFHDAGTFQPPSSGGLTGYVGGADGSIMYFLNSSIAPDNAGLAESIAPHFMQNPSVSITSADMIALAGQVSVSHCGGPNITTFQAGRLDASAANAVSPQGRLPAANITLADFRITATTMGWNDQDIVALVTGSHTMGGVHAINSPELTNQTFIPFDDTAGVFDNRVFQFTLQGHCPVPIDCEIAKDATLGPIVQLFANNQSAFFAQYAISFQKLNSQTTSTLGPNLAINVPPHQGLLTTTQPVCPFLLSGGNATTSTTVSGGVSTSSSNPSGKTGSAQSSAITSSSLSSSLILLLCTFLFTCL